MTDLLMLRAFLSKTFLSEFVLSTIRPSKTASACIAASRRSMGLFPIWTEPLAQLTGYSLSEVLPLVDLYFW